jgi:conjugal transfer pilus assembly protein TraU
MSRSLKRPFREHRVCALLSLFFVFFFISFSLYADESGKPEGRCKNEFPNLIGDICWKCMFPIRIGGKKIFDSGSMPDNLSDITGNPDDYNPDEYICSCEDSNGRIRFGIYISFWDPARVLETVEQPGCFPFLFGLDMGESVDIFGGYGTRGRGEENREEGKAFFNVHYYVFPLLYLLDLIVGAEFCTDWLSEIDLLYLTEVDPLWNDDELTFYTHPEASVFSNEIAQALCSADCIATTTGFPLNAMFWCAGCWGPMYPYTGNTGLKDSSVSTTSLLTSRLIARMARLPVPPAIEYDTSSSGAKCGGIIRPLIKKSQYKFSTIFPIPETESRCCHSLGESSFTWGEYRNIPGAGEHQTYLMWRKRNCCLKIF